VPHHQAPSDCLSPLTITGEYIDGDEGERISGSDNNPEIKVWTMAMTVMIPIQISYRKLIDHLSMAKAFHQSLELGQGLKMVHDLPDASWKRMERSSEPSLDVNREAAFQATKDQAEQQGEM
jgi:hypothetical protein